MSGFVFHYIDARGLLTAYKLHTPAEDMTKNRATKRDVIKVALFQQALQCTIGYLTSGPDDFVPHVSGIGQWIQTIRNVESLILQWMRNTEPRLLWILKEPKTYESAPIVSYQSKVSHSIMTNFSQMAVAYTGNDLSSSASEIFAAKALYWIIVPLLQYIVVMFLADTFQYFTHRALHVNKFLYSKQEIQPSSSAPAYDAKQSMSTHYTTKYMFPTPTGLSTIIH